MFVIECTTAIIQENIVSAENSLENSDDFQNGKKMTNLAYENRANSINHVENKHRKLLKQA